MVKPVKMPRFVQWIFPRQIWAFSRFERNIYLTFDDGPHETITPWVLNELKKYNAKATFFCVGDNVRKNPAVLQEIVKHGHSIGNHTFNHLKGSKTTTSEYFENVLKAGEILEETIPKEKLISSKTAKMLFRPPYGRISRKQAQKVEMAGYSIIMWDIISYDYDNQISPKKCLKNVLDACENGSIIVMHDSLKAEKNLRYILPELLKTLSERGYVFEKI